ncbi:MAG: glycosyltransferase family 4 protein [Firmicutes bacterium]|nr:glycosyltransferase family 4 protein [Bacillota bacterium]
MSGTPTRVLYVITRSEPGGAQTHVLNLLEGLNDVERGLVTGEEEMLASRARTLGSTVWILPHLVRRISPWNDVRTVVDLRRIIREFRPDVVHCHSSKAGFLGRLAARLEGVPAIFTAHGWAFSEGTPWPRRLVALLAEKVAARWSSAIIVVSKHDRGLADRCRVAPPGLLHLIHNAIPDCGQRAKPGNGRPVTISMVARFAHPKDHIALVKALEPLDGDWRLWFIGDGPLLPAVHKYVDRRGLSGRVEFLGQRHDVASLLAQSHIFCLISRYEGLPISIIEALMAGLPVVASDVGGVSELVSDGVNGYLIPAGDRSVSVLRERLACLIKKPDLRRQYGAMGRRLYEHLFRFEDHLGKTRSLYYRVAQLAGGTADRTP